MEDKKPQEDLNGPLPKSPDFYIEDGKYVFTKEFHLRRGSCCGNGCRNCPYQPIHKKGNTTIFIDNG
jgi:hypothetical protein